MELPHLDGKYIRTQLVRYWQDVIFQCRPARFEMSQIPRMKEAGKNMCPQAESEGIGFLHGNSQVPSQMESASGNRPFLFQAFSTRRDTLGKGIDGDAVFRAVFQSWVKQVFNSWKAQSLMCPGFEKMGSDVWSKGPTNNN